MTPDLIAAWMLGGLAFGLLCVGVQGLRERDRGRRAMRRPSVPPHRELMHVRNLRCQEARARLDAEFYAWMEEARWGRT